MFQIHTCRNHSLRWVLPCVAYFQAANLLFFWCYHPHNDLDLVLTCCLFIADLISFWLLLILICLLPFRVYLPAFERRLCHKTDMPSFGERSPHGYIVIIPSPCLRLLPPIAPAVSSAFDTFLYIGSLAFSVLVLYIRPPLLCFCAQVIPISNPIYHTYLIATFFIDNSEK